MFLRLNQFYTKYFCTLIHYTEITDSFLFHMQTYNLIRLSNGKSIYLAYNHT